MAKLCSKNANDKKILFVYDISIAIILVFYFLFFFFSSRRGNKIEDGFNGKRCVTWFREYTTIDEPDTLGKYYYLNYFD